MKKNYFLVLILTLCFSTLSFGQGTETFANSNATTSYADNSFVGENGITWTYVASRNANGDANGSGISLPALMLRRVSSGSKVTSSLISGGIGDFSVKLYKGFTGGGDRQVELFVNGVSRGTSTPFDDFSEHIFTVSGINVTGDITIELVNTTSKQVIVDDITWTAASSDPSLSISAPSNNAVYPSTTTTEVPVTLNVSNFTLSGDNGAGMTDNSGDGYIKATLDETGQATEITSFFTTTPTPITVVAGRSYTATVELVDNAGASLTPQVMASVSFSVENPCDLVLGAIETTCDALTSVTDTFSGSIAFTGGNTGITYTITAPAGVTVGGDNPDTSENGTITFSGMTEGTDYDIDIVGGAGSSCDYDRTLYSPTCVSFPVYESFDYTVGTDLMASPLWQNNSNSSDEIQVVAGTIANPFGPGQFPDPVGNMVSFDGSGSDSYIEFNQRSTGKIYASFIFTVTDISMQQANGGYFAILSEADGSFKGRIWVRPEPSDNTMYNVGLSTGDNGTATYHTVMHTTGEEIFVVMSFDFTTNDFNVWIDPDPATFEATEPAADMTLGDTLTDLGRFGLRQDDGDETPPINFDELRISTTWAEVTPKTATASLGDNIIEGFAAYPNPIDNKRFTITTNSISEKTVKIFNVLGRQVYATNFSSNNKLVDISSLSTGVYILKVQEVSKIATKKLVVR